MKKRISLAVFIAVTILIAGTSYGFWNAKTEKAAPNDNKGSGMAFPEKMAQLSRNMMLWERMNADEKKQAVEAVITLYKNRDNAAILKPGEFYVGKIDETLKANPPVAYMDIMTLMRTLSVMEYDFYNGQNKDELARKTLGEKGFAQNQMRRRISAQSSTQQK